MKVAPYCQLEAGPNNGLLKLCGGLFASHYSPLLRTAGIAKSKLFSNIAKNTWARFPKCRHRNRDKRRIISLSFAHAIDDACLHRAKECRSSVDRNVDDVKDAYTM